MTTFTRIRSLVAAGAIAVAGLVGTSAQATAADFTIIGAAIPPYGIAEGKELAGGVMIDATREVARRIGHSEEIRLMPWGRAYDTLQARDGMLIAMMVRTPAREDLFHWVAPIIPDRIQLYTFGDAAPLSIADAPSARRIGVQLNTPMQQLAEKRFGWTNLQVANDATALMNLLVSGRIDAMLNLESVAFYTVQEAGKQITDLVAGEQVAAFEVYIAGSKNLTAADTQGWADAVEAMKADGTLNEILAKYGLVDLLG